MTCDKPGAETVPVETLQQQFCAKFTFVEEVPSNRGPQDTGSLDAEQAVQAFAVSKDSKLPDVEVGAADSIIRPFATIRSPGWSAQKLAAASSSTEPPSASAPVKAPTDFLTSAPAKPKHGAGSSRTGQMDRLVEMQSEAMQLLATTIASSNSLLERMMKAITDAPAPRDHHRHRRHDRSRHRESSRRGSTVAVAVAEQ